MSGKPLELSKETLRWRMLIITYSLANGQEGVPVSLQAIQQESERIGVKGMTDAEFELYRQQAIARAAVVGKKGVAS